MIFNSAIYNLADNGNDGGVYSTEEVRIGTWIDGKPLYRKVIEGVTPSNSGQTSTVANFIGLHAKLVSVRGLIFSPTTNNLVGIAPSTYGSGTSAGLSINGTVVNCYVSGNTTFYSAKILVIGEYTKTTD